MTIQVAIRAVWQRLHRFPTRTAAFHASAPLNEHPYPLESVRVRRAARSGFVYWRDRHTVCDDLNCCVPNSQGHAFTENFPKQFMAVGQVKNHLGSNFRKVKSKAGMVNWPPTSRYIIIQREYEPVPSAANGF